MKKILTLRDIESGELTVCFQGDWTQEEKLKARQTIPEIADLPEKKKFNAGDSKGIQ